MLDKFSDSIYLKNELKRVFSFLNEACIDSILKQSKLYNVIEGEIVINQNTASNNLVFLIEGMLSVEIESKNENYIAHFINSGELFYNNECFLACNYLSSAVAVIPSKLLLIPSEILKSIGKENPQLILQMLNWGCKEKSFFEEHAHQLRSYPVKQRLLLALKQLQKHKREKNIIPLKTEMIGRFISASKSSLFRSIAELENKKIIQTNKFGIRILAPLSSEK